MTKTIIKVDIEALNAEFESLGFRERISRLYEYFPVDQVLFTSSFGTKSVVMLTLTYCFDREATSYREAA